jgi:hypothetical protein
MVHTFFSSTQGQSSDRLYKGQKLSLRRFKKDMAKYLFQTKQTNLRKNQKFKHLWKLNNAFNKQGKKES